MKLYSIPSFYIVTDIRWHKQTKNKIINAINRLPKSNIDTEREKINQTDWNLPRDLKREYLPIFYETVRPYLDEMADKLNMKKWKCINFWCQKYTKGDFHDWHTHPEGDYTNVYFVKLPNKSLQTELYDLKDKKIIKTIDVTEGQMLTFPSSIMHRSPTNNMDDEKIIISFNTVFDELHT